MNTETQPTTAAELLAEWKRLQLIDPDYGHLPNGEAHLQNSIDDMLMTNIAARLDEMCKEDGISEIDGFPQFANVDGRTVIGKHGPLSIRELKIRLEWLLIKAQAQ